MTSHKKIVADVMPNPMPVPKKTIKMKLAFFKLSYGNSHTIIREPIRQGFIIPNMSTN